MEGQIKRNRTRWNCILLPAFLLLSGCSFVTYELTEAPASIREAAFREALRYDGMEYELGGQDFPRGIDCSGLVVNVYHTVTSGTGYSMLFYDARAVDLHDRYSRAIVSPEPPETGDLIFMGDEYSGIINHVAICESIQDDLIYFIDATSGSINQVSRRSMPLHDLRIKGFGRMLLNRVSTDR